MDERRIGVVERSKRIQNICLLRKMCRQRALA